MDEYDAEFTELSRFAPYMVSTEVNWSKRFLQGVHMELQSHLIAPDFTTILGVLSADA